jgi:hypothetical protein
LVEADDDGLYVVKFRGAGQGLKALVAELVVGCLGHAAGLPVPELVLVEVSPELGRTEPDPEVNELVTSSAGVNFGMDFLPGALDYAPGSGQSAQPEFAAGVVWFDALMTNVDRTPRNPNLLVWHGRTWLIDHGAALYQRHSERDFAARAREPFPMIADHVLLSVAGPIAASDERLAPEFTEARIDAALDAVPDEWLGEEPELERQVYRRYLLDRLQAPRGFVQEAERARVA